MILDCPSPGGKSMPKTVPGFAAKILVALLLSLGWLTVWGARASATTLTFGEVPFQSVNGLTVQGVTFTFTVGGSPSTDAFYNSGGPGVTTYISDPSLEGNSAGVLTLDFAAPTTVLQFGVAISEFTTLSPGFTVQLFNASLASIGTFPVITNPMPAFSEGQFSYNNTTTPVKRARISFAVPFSGSRFAFDNLTYNQSGTGPVLSVSPTLLQFDGVAGGSAQTLSLGVTTASSTSFTASAAVLNGANWLSVSPTSGSTVATGITTESTTGAAAASSRLSVVVNFAVLTAGRFGGGGSVGAGAPA